MSQRWFLARDGQTIGPFSSADLKAQAAAGELGPEEIVLLEGETRWVKASTLKGLFPAAGGAEPAPARPVAPAKPIVGLVDLGSPAMAKEPDAPATVGPKRPMLLWAGAA